METGIWAVETLQGTGTSCIVLTLGEKGLLYSQLMKKELNEWSAIKHIEAEKMNVVDTTVSHASEGGMEENCILNCLADLSLGRSLGNFWPLLPALCSIVNRATETTLITSPG